MVERQMGVEPTSSAWKADILADVRLAHDTRILWRRVFHPSVSI